MINTEHPKYPEFMKKFDAICEEYKDLRDDKVPAELFDCIYKEYARKITALQIEYEFLWPGGLK